MLITFVIASALAAAPTKTAGTAGAYTAVVGLQEAATHDIRFAGGAWFEQDMGPGNFSADLYVARGRDGGTGYEFRSGNARLAAMYGWSGGRQAVQVNFGVGPAVAARIGRFEAAGSIEPIINIEPALRGRMGLNGPIRGPLAFSWHMGVTARPGGVDYDSGLGLGVWW